MIAKLHAYCLDMSSLSLIAFLFKYNETKGQDKCQKQLLVKFLVRSTTRFSFDLFFFVSHSNIANNTDDYISLLS